MTVKDLKQKLEKFDENAVVKFQCEGVLCNIRDPKTPEWLDEKVVLLGSA